MNTRHLGLRFLPYLLGSLVLCILILCVGCQHTQRDALPHDSSVGLITAANLCDEFEVQRWAHQGARQIVLRVEERDALSELDAAARAIRSAGLELSYWIEVARCPSLADAHPEWMASLQGHDEWRAEHPDAPAVREGEVLKVWPWVPILSQEGFTAQLDRVRALLEVLPAADAIYLNGLQAAPSACGCGHPLCRWSADYFLRTSEHPVRIASATPLEPDAATRFVIAVAALVPNAVVIPVWVAECAVDDAKCHGVPCFEGRCWPALAEQWKPLTDTFEQLAVFVPSRSVGLPSNPMRIEQELDSLARIDRPGAPRIAVERSRLLPVLEGAAIWPGRYLRSTVELDQSWEPRVWPAR